MGGLGGGGGGGCLGWIGAGWERGSKSIMGLQP